MNLPAFYDPATVGQLYQPDLLRAYEAGLAAFTRPASTDSPRILLWLVDVQVDFVLPAPIGRLPVPGAVADTQRTLEWIYRSVQHLTHITASLDTHLPLHIFFASWWRDARGQHPAPYTIITADEVEKGNWLPIQDAEWSLYYVQTLESVGKKQLMIWPFHCMEGTEGRAFVPALSEAILYHSGARMAQPTLLTKGTIPQTEFYSVVEPEVKVPGHPDGGLNVDFLRFVAEFDLIYIAGQARSHCVLETMHSVLRHFGDQPNVINKLRFLDDCTSSITGFEEATEVQYQQFAAGGLRLVKSTDSLW